MLSPFSFLFLKGFIVFSYSLFHILEWPNTFIVDLSICLFVQCFVDILERPITCAVYLFSDFGKISCLNFFYLLCLRDTHYLFFWICWILLKFIGCIVTLWCFWEANCLYFRLLFRILFVTSFIKFCLFIYSRYLGKSISFVFDMFGSIEEICKM